MASPTLHDKLDKVQATQTETLLMLKELTVKQVYDEQGIEDNKNLSKKNESLIVQINTELAEIKVLIMSFKENDKSRRAKVMLVLAQVLSTLGAIVVIIVGASVK
jgi:hypothetical protein